MRGVMMSSGGVMRVVMMSLGRVMRGVMMSSGRVMRGVMMSSGGWPESRDFFLIAAHDVFCVWYCDFLESTSGLVTQSSALQVFCGDYLTLLLDWA